ncbi:glutathione S-transferase family protein [Caenimonas sedimenti]|uniref:glutathione transferase n=1 Tax=Caenimonas sedimenti TaxID=2596921 RepID=A0A562ZNP7_9BURK|nr:glutathione S-transferase family protein [Caenimonas sedimenti]TWO69986.1 glutathione S-transferase family protein [Caenimonas sedimenti]
MLTIHHLGKSQSERIVWLCEELGIPYDLKHHVRDPVTKLSPPELRALHPMGTAPVITDGDLLMAESGAIVDYIIARHGGGRLALGPSHPDFAAYLYWFHFANASFQAVMGRNMIQSRLNLPPGNPVAAGVAERLVRALKFVDSRLSDAPYLAGAEFTAADIMIVFSLTTMRYFHPVELAPYPSILAYLRRIGERDAYRRAMAKGDPGMPLLLS